MRSLDVKRHAKFACIVDAGDMSRQAVSAASEPHSPGDSSGLGTQFMSNRAHHVDDQHHQIVYHQSEGRFQNETGNGLDEWRFGV